MIVECPIFIFFSVLPDISFPISTEKKSKQSQPNQFVSLLSSTHAQQTHYYYSIKKEKKKKKETSQNSISQTLNNPLRKQETK